MGAKHGTQRRYAVEGCRCEDCKEAHRVSARDYRERKATGQTRPGTVVVVRPVVEPDGPGPVEAGVAAEISDAAAQARPGLAQAALALARVLDNPRAISQKAAAAKVLATLLSQLHAAAARTRRGGLSVVRDMTTKR